MTLQIKGSVYIVRDAGGYGTEIHGVFSDYDQAWEYEQYLIDTRDREERSLYIEQRDLDYRYI